MWCTLLVQGAEAPRVDIAEAQPLESFPRAVQEHICEHPPRLHSLLPNPRPGFPTLGAVLSHPVLHGQSCPVLRGGDRGSIGKVFCACAVLDDLLFAFMGLDGKYVRATKVVQPDGVHISYRLRTQANPALRELSTRMLALW